MKGHSMVAFGREWKLYERRLGAAVLSLSLKDQREFDRLQRKAYRDYLRTRAR